MNSALPTLLGTLLLFASTLPAAAELAIVPRDHPTVQRAIDAVAGTPDARVRIDSNRTFDETLRIRASVVIEAGERYHPTIRGRRETCASPIPAAPVNCTIDLQAPPRAVPHVLLRGLRLVPANNARPGDRVVNAWADSTGGAELYLSNVTIDNRGKGIDGIAFHEDGGEDAESVLIVQDSLLRLGGGGEVSGVVATGLASLHVDRSRLVMTGAVNIGISSSNPSAGLQTQVQIDQSTFDVMAKSASSPSAHVVLEQSPLEAADNSFFSRTAARSMIFGIFDFGTYQPPKTLIDRNGFDHKGRGQAAALVFSPRRTHTIAGLVADNVVTNHVAALVVTPQAGDDNQAPSLTALDVVNNTFDRSSSDAVSLDSSYGANVAIDFSNNLVTRSGGYAVSIANDGGSFRFEGGSNGYFANARGNVEEPYSTKVDVLADPAYLSNTDLRLRDGSPMIDAGDDRSAPSHLLFDRRGNARRTGRIDIGAFERPLPSRNPS
jgi:hypothetical protein